MSAPFIIMFHGPAGSGKTTLAKYLCSQVFFGVVPVPLKFASVLYRLEKVVWEEMEKCGIKRPCTYDRRLLQVLGTEWGREVDPNIWVRVLMNTLEEHNKSNPVLPFNIYIIDDLRFPNEYAAFPDALKICLDASIDVRRNRAEKWFEGNHISETALDSFKFDLYLDTERDLRITKLALHDFVQKKLLERAF